MWPVRYKPLHPRSLQLVASLWALGIAAAQPMLCNYYVLVRQLGHLAISEPHYDAEMSLASTKLK
jgi:hypothetical protein